MLLFLVILRDFEVFCLRIWYGILILFKWFFVWRYNWVLFVENFICLIGLCVFIWIFLLFLNKWILLLRLFLFIWNIWICCCVFLCGRYLVNKFNWNICVRIEVVIDNLFILIMIGFKFWIWCKGLIGLLKVGIFKFIFVFNLLE